MDGCNLSNREKLAIATPRCCDDLFTRLSGVMLEGQTLPRRSKSGRVLESLATFSIGIASGVGALPILGTAGIALLPFAAAVAISGARELQLVALHHAAHSNVFSGEKNKLLGRFIATLIVIEHFDSYAPRHTIGHHGRHTVSTREDDTLSFLQDVIGIMPGAPVEDNRRRFLAALISPRVHWTMLRRRLRSQFITGSWANRAAAGSYLAVAVALTAGTGAWLPAALGWVLPLTVGYQAAQCARLIVEHHWPAEPAPGGRRSVEDHDRLTAAVRCAVPPPARWTFRSTLGWSAEIAFNAVIRCLVLPGDSGPSHHWHHARVRGDWANHIAEAAAWEKQRQADGRAPPKEAWGYREALRLALESFALATPEALVPPRPAGVKLGAAT